VTTNEELLRYISKRLEQLHVDSCSLISQTEDMADMLEDNFIKSRASGQVESHMLIDRAVFDLRVLIGKHLPGEGVVPR
jgi:hypothetical protein